MFVFSINHPMKVYRSGSFEKADGTKGAYIICRECDNQPDGLERPSKSRKPIKFWLETLPEGVVNDGYIIFSEIIGGEWKDIPAVDVNGNRLKDRFGHDIFNSELCLTVEGLKSFTEIPEDVKPGKKAKN